MNVLRYVLIGLLVLSIVIAGCTGAPGASEDSKETSGDICGNDVCEGGESSSTCPKDCGPESDSEGPPVPTSY